MGQVIRATGREGTQRGRDDELDVFSTWEAPTRRHSRVPDPRKSPRATHASCPGHSTAETNTPKIHVTREEGGQTKTQKRSASTRHFRQSDRSHFGDSPITAWRTLQASSKSLEGSYANAPAKYVSYFPHAIDSVPIGVICICKEQDSGIKSGAHAPVIDPKRWPYLDS